MTAGAVDVICFLGLNGLFTAHITGNLVVLAAHYVTGGFSQIGPLLSVPVFVIVLALVTFVAKTAEPTTASRRRTLLFLQTLCLAASLAVWATLGPFAEADRPMAVLAGMLAVAAMAIQNALVKLGFHGVPSTAVLTTNTTQFVIDLVTVIAGRDAPDAVAHARRRARVTLHSILGFIVGCVAGAVLEMHYNLAALTLPVVLATVSVALGELSSPLPPAIAPATRRDAIEDVDH